MCDRVILRILGQATNLLLKLLPLKCQKIVHAVNAMHLYLDQCPLVHGLQYLTLQSS